MLQFLRKYQKIIFIVITTVIISSFVFFGTYQALAPGYAPSQETTSYVTSDGKKIGSHYFGALCQFLKTEGTGRDILQTNFLSDQLISQDFLQTGLVYDLIAHEPTVYAQDLDERLQKEKIFKPYTHPMAQQISAQGVWDVFAPDLSAKLKEHQQAECGLSGLKSKVELYLAQRNFPPHFLANMLRYQEKDNKAVMPDNKLARGEVFVYNYHTIEDWFGTPFVERAAQFVIEVVAQAKKSGIKVSQEEAEAEIAFKCQKAFGSIKNNLPPNLDMDASKLYVLFMRENGYDPKVLLSVYQDLMVYRRFLKASSENVKIEGLPFESFYAKASESFDIELKQMPTALRLKSFDDLKDFECYLAAIGYPAKDLLLPQTATPRDELVGTQYELYIATVNKEQLEAKVTLKQTWQWQEAHEAVLKKQFSYLSSVSGPILAAIDQLDVKKKAAVDSFTRRQIVEQHPEWLEDRVKSENMAFKTCFLSKKGAKADLPGIKDAAALKRALDEKDEIVNYSQDNQHFHRILVQSRKPDQVLSFTEARASGVLKGLYATLEAETRAKAVIAKTKDYLKGKALSVSDDEAIWHRFAMALQTQPTMLEQFMPITREMAVNRAENSFITFEGLSEGSEGQGACEREGAYEFKVKGHHLDKTAPVDKMMQANDWMAMEIKTQVLKDLFKSVHAR